MRRSNTDNGSQHLSGTIAPRHLIRGIATVAGSYALLEALLG